MMLTIRKVADDDQHRADDGVEILPEDHLDAVARDAGPDEHRFDQEGVAEQRREVEAEDGQRRDEGRAEGVAGGDPLRREAVGAAISI